MDEGNEGSGKERLTRDRICEVALETIDATGLDSVSMRTLASALGVKASSLYYHFESKEQLLTGVAEFLYRRLGRPPSEGEWTDQVRATFVQLYDFIQAHPNAAPLLVRDLAYSSVAKKRANVLLRIVSRAGLDVDASAGLMGNLVALLVGHTFLGVWLREGSGSMPEAGPREGLGKTAYGPDLDGSRPWVHRLFPTETVGFDGSRAALLVGSAASDTRAAAAEDRALAERKSGLLVDANTGADARSPGDVAFLTGLDALIRGFASYRRPST